MRLEITPVYTAMFESGKVDKATKDLVSVRKRIYTEEGSLIGEWFLDWRTGEWAAVVAPERVIEINEETRKLLGWKSDAFAV